ncbi:hypothetical protein C8J57DRAFT_1065332 [Mycena rebaudengoi]|nr:hypothetical protein C8J57DRAFT_1065332 [Mycena rebaudengoi]
MFSLYPSYRPQPSYYQPSYYHPSSYARAAAEQQQRSRALQEMERQRMARSQYFPDGYAEPDSDDDYGYYLTPRQRALLQAKQRQEALEKRRQEAARARQEEESILHERALKQRETLRRTAQKDKSPPPASSSPSPSPAAAAGSPPPAVSHFIPPPPSPVVLNEAATKIQTRYRIHRSLRAISELEAKFQSLKNSFIRPSIIDYQGPEGQIISVNVGSSASILPDVSENPKLAFTPTNVPLHTHMELLSRLLVALDAVESWGDQKVRERRRSVVRKIEAEAGSLEEFWRDVWAQGQRDLDHHDEEEVCGMVVDSEVEAADDIAIPELSAAQESDSDADSDFLTPPATPAEPPKLTLAQDYVDVDVDVDVDGPIGDVVSEDDKMQESFKLGDDFVLV